MDKRKMMTIVRLLLFPAVLFITCIMRVSVHAENMPVCREAVADEKKIKAYVQDVYSSEDAKYQIGNIPADRLTAYSIAEDSQPVRTLLMLDNSFSIPDGARGEITELMVGIIDAHMQNETFRVATFSGDTRYLSDSYSDDYTAVKNVTESISYNDQVTYLTDALYTVIEDLNQDHYMGYTRIIIISDGVDNNPSGITREELNIKLGDTPYPVYTVGIKTGNNDEQLKNMYALSRVTETSYWTLAEQDTQEVISRIGEDGSLTVFEADIPENAKTGGIQNSKLTLADNHEIVFKVNTPFAVKEEPAQTESAKTEPETKPPVEPETEPEEKSGNGLLIAGIAISSAVLAAVIVFLIIKHGKKKNEVRNQQDHISDQEKDIKKDTEMVRPPRTEGLLDSSNEAVPALFPGGAGKAIHRLTLTDKKDLSRTFQCELKGAVNIGREPGNDLVLSYDTTISAKHCMIMSKSGRFFIQDLGSSNKTYLNGIQVLSETEIVSGSTIKLGRTELTVKIEAMY